MALANGIDPSTGQKVPFDVTDPHYMETLHDIVMQPLMEVLLAAASCSNDARLMYIYVRMVWTSGGLTGNKEARTEFTSITSIRPT